MPEMIPVLSTNIAAVGYDAVRSVLFVRFHGRSSTYSYRDVDFSVYRAFLSAPSKGRFFDRIIKGQYAYARVA